MEGILPIILLIIVGNIFRGVMKAKNNAPRKGQLEGEKTPAQEIKEALFEQMGGAFGQGESVQSSGASVVPTPNLNWAASSPEPKKADGPGNLTGSPLLQNSPREEMESRLETATLSEGFSREDDEGCVGGSMKHTESEGRMHARVLTQAAAPAEATAATVSVVSSAQLRQAVIMSEILRAPVTLRGRATRR